MSTPDNGDLRHDCPFCGAQSSSRSHFNVEFLGEFFGTPWVFTRVYMPSGVTQQVSYGYCCVSCYTSIQILYRIAHNLEGVYLA